MTRFSTMYARIAQGGHLIGCTVRVFPIASSRESHDGNAYRAVYTVRYADAVYVLHAFQKKSKKSIATPKTEVDLIQKRLKDLIKKQEPRR
jgi:phage-related protein